MWGALIKGVLKGAGSIGKRIIQKRAENGKKPIFGGLFRKLGGVAVEKIEEKAATYEERGTQDNGLYIPEIPVKAVDNNPNQSNNNTNNNSQMAKYGFIGAVALAVIAMMKK